MGPTSVWTCVWRPAGGRRPHLYDLTASAWASRRLWPHCHLPVRGGRERRVSRRQLELERPDRATQCNIVSPAPPSRPWQVPSGAIQAPVPPTVVALVDARGKGAVAVLVGADHPGLVEAGGGEGRGVVGGSGGGWGEEPWRAQAGARLGAITQGSLKLGGGGGGGAGKRGASPHARGWKHTSQGAGAAPARARDGRRRRGGSVHNPAHVTQCLARSPKLSNATLAANEPRASARHAHHTIAIHVHFTARRATNNQLTSPIA